MDRPELAHWLRLTLTPGIGNSTGRSLLARYGLPQHIFAQPTLSLRAIVGPTQAQALAQLPDGFDAQLQRTWDWLHPAHPSAATDGARAVITLADACYPTALLAIEDPPLLLYVQGAARWLETPAVPAAALGLARCIAIVGSRNPTPQGSENARHFATALVQAGLTVVSGLARGVDGAAHLGALDGASDSADHPATVAVVGTGLDRVYPKSHLSLARRITGQALMISEYPIGTPPLAANFPRRNRIISGLSLGTLVVEAALQSGSLITARLASEQGKEVFAIPGSIHAAQSRGCHALIRQGAKLVESALDVLEELPGHTATPLGDQQRGVAAASAPAAPPTGAADPALLQALGYDPTSLDALQNRTGIDTARLQAQLMELELAGWVCRLPGGLFQRLAGA